MSRKRPAYPPRKLSVLRELMAGAGWSIRWSVKLATLAVSIFTLLLLFEAYLRIAETQTVVIGYVTDEYAMDCEDIGPMACPLQLPSDIPLRTPLAWLDGLGLSKPVSNLANRVVNAYLALPALAPPSRLSEQNLP